MVKGKDGLFTIVSQHRLSSTYNRCRRCIYLWLQIKLSAAALRRCLDGCFVRSLQARLGGSVTAGSQAHFEQPTERESTAQLYGRTDLYSSMTLGQKMLTFNSPCEAIELAPLHLLSRVS
jgi:hypothetical protein